MLFYFFTLPYALSINSNCLASHKRINDSRLGYPDFYFKHVADYRSDKVPCDVKPCGVDFSEVLDYEANYPNNCSFEAHRKCPVISTYIEGALSVPSWKYIISIT